MAAVVGACVLLGVAGVVIGEATCWRVLRGPLGRALTQAAGVPVAFGAPADRFALKLIGRPHLELGALTVGAAPGPAAPYLLSGQDLRLAWRWGDAWHFWRGSAPLRVAALDASRLDVNLLRDAAGRATWQIGPAAGKPPQVPKPEGRLDLPQVETLVVRAGRIVFDDEALATRLVADIAGRESEIDDRDQSKGKGKGKGDGAAGGSGGSGGAQAGWRAQVEGRWHALPLHLNVLTGSAMPLVADVAEAAIALRVEGRVGAARVLFDGKAGALLGARRLDGDLKFGGPSLAQVGAPLGVTLPQTPAFDLEGHLAHDAGVWQLQARRATIGKSRLGGNFRYDTRPELPLLTGRLTGSRLALADLGPAVGAPTGGRAAPDAAQPGRTPANTPANAPANTGRVLPQRSFDLPSLQAMNADVQVAIDELDFGTQALAPLRGVATRVVLQAGRLELQQVKATVAGGTLTGTTTYDSATPTAEWTAKMRFAGVDIAGWLRGTQTPQASAAPPAGATQGTRLKQERQQARQGGDQVVRNYVTGALDATFDVRGSGDSTGQILSTLNGRFDLTLRDGTLSHLVTEAAGLDVAQGLGVLIRGDRPLPLRCARVQATARNGVVRTDRGVIDNADSTLRLAGELNLKDETLALVATSRPKDFSPLSLRTPITLRGTLAQPRIGLEGGKLVGKVGIAAALGAAIGPFAALIPLIDFGQKEEGDACASAPTVPAAPAAPTPPRAKAPAATPAAAAGR